MNVFTPALASAFLIATAAESSAEPVLRAVPQNVGVSSERVKRIDVGFERAIDRGDLPDATITVARGGKLVTGSQASAIRKVRSRSRRSRLSLVQQRIAVDLSQHGLFFVLQMSMSPSRSEKTMKPRIEYAKVAPDAFKAIVALKNHVDQSGLEPGLLDLVNTRASQLNGCAYCIHLHTREARSRGESEERLYLLDAWRESPLYTEQERAALTWTEAVTLVSQTHVPDEVFAEARRHRTKFRRGCHTGGSWIVKMSEPTEGDEP